MPDEMMNTREVSEYLGINEKQVYALIKAGRIPCTRVTGKWVFPKKLIDEWITVTAKESAHYGETTPRRSRNLLAAGSNDPVLDLLINQNNESNLKIFSCNTGSTEGLRLMEESRTDIAWCHLLDPETGTYNIPQIDTRLSGRKVAVVRLFYREIGIVSAQDSGKKMKSIADLAGGTRLVNRQPGSGIRVFLDHGLQKEGIDPSAIEGYDNEVRTHFEVGLAILSGAADAGIASVAISKLFSLPFTPLARECFDMIIDRDVFFEKGIQSFIETLQSDSFRKSVAPLGDYDFSDAGKILHSTPG